MKYKPVELLIDSKLSIGTKGNKVPYKTSKVSLLFSGEKYKNNKTEIPINFIIDVSNKSLKTKNKKRVC